MQDTLTVLRAVKDWKLDLPVTYVEMELDPVLDTEVEHEDDDEDDAQIREEEGENNLQAGKREGIHLDEEESDNSEESGPKNSQVDEERERDDREEGQSDTMDQDGDASKGAEPVVGIQMQELDDGDESSELSSDDSGEGEGVREGNMDEDTMDSTRFEYAGKRSRTEEESEDNSMGELSTYEYHGKEY